MAHRAIPTNLVIEMIKRGYNNVDIIRYLKEKGYSPVEMNDAFNQAKVKLEISRAQEQEEQPATPQYEEAPIDTKPNPALGDITNKLKTTDIKIKEIEEKLRILNSHLDNMQKRLVTKFQENSEIMSNISSQLAALQKSFTKILEPLAENVKIKSGMLGIDEKKEKKQPDKEIVREKHIIRERPKKSGEVEKTTTIIKEKKVTKPKKKSKPSLDDQFK